MNIEEMKELMVQMRLQGITSLVLEQGDVKLRLKRASGETESQGPAIAAVHDKEPDMPLAVPVEEEPAGLSIEVRSPVVGVYFASPSPDSPPFVRVGDTVETGQTLCIVEAMKLMNEVSSPCSGTLLDILRENGGNVEYGQLLFKILPADAE